MLGSVEARRDGLRLTVPGGRSAELLVRLALEAGQPVRAERLLDELWPEPAGRNTLQSKVARLRRALGDPAVIAGDDHGYRLAVEPGAVDALVVAEDAAAAQDLLAAGEDAAAAELSARALERFHGEVLQSAGDGEWTAPHRTRLEEVRLDLIETRCAARLRLGDVAEVVGDAEAAIAANPYRETLWELLITALYRAGRQSDALDAYQRVRARLSGDLGLEPGPRLRRLQEQILRHEADLAVAEPDAPQGNLPALAVELVGREESVGDVARLLGEHRLVDVVGPGGLSSTVGSEAWNSRDLKSRPH